MDLPDACSIEAEIIRIFPVLAFCADLDGRIFWKCCALLVRGGMESFNYQGLNATTFLETDFPQDAAAIRWLKDNIEGSPVVLEANGDSYTGYERVFGHHRTSDSAWLVCSRMALEK